MDKNKINFLIGNIIELLRQECGLSRYALSKNAGVDSSWLRRLEQGKSGIKVETLIALAKGLQIPTADLVTIIEKVIDEGEPLSPDKAVSQFLSNTERKNK